MEGAGDASDARKPAAAAADEVSSVPDWGDTNRIETASTA
jgi:hypothetical protein